MSSQSFYTDELREKVINYALRKAETQEYISLGHLLNFTGRVLKAQYKKSMTKKRAYNLKRWIQRTLHNTGFFYTIKMNGLIWFTTTPAGRQQYIDLIRGRLAPKQNSNSLENTGFPSYRNEAGRIIMDHIYLNEDQYDELADYFNAYLDAIDAKTIILRHKVEREKFMLVGYTTRFNSERRRKKLLARYDHAWSYATQHYKNGVFLTLTTDPSQFSSIYEATMAISWAWNSFMSWLQKRLGQRPPYIKVLEFTKRGLPHLHVVFFDVGYLADHEEITEEWNRLGQGIINYEYSIINKNGRWTWKKRKPKDGGRSVKQYLKKYLLKTISMKDSALGTLALYWITNRRFYTTARILQKKIKYLLRTGEWEFFGTAWDYELEDIIPFWAWHDIKDFREGG